MIKLIEEYTKVIIDMRIAQRYSYRHTSQQCANIVKMKLMKNALWRVKLGHSSLIQKLRWVLDLHEWGRYQEIKKSDALGEA